MIITCNRILFPPSIEDDDEIIREAKMKQMARNIRKRRIMFHLADVEKFGEHEDKAYTQIWFYYSEPIVIDYNFGKLEEEYKKWYAEQEEDEEDGGFRFYIPMN